MKRPLLYDGVIIDKTISEVIVPKVLSYTVRVIFFRSGQHTSCQCRQNLSATTVYLIDLPHWKRLAHPVTCDLEFQTSIYKRVSLFSIVHKSCLYCVRYKSGCLPMERDQW